MPYLAEYHGRLSGFTSWWAWECDGVDSGSGDSGFLTCDCGAAAGARAVEAIAEAEAEEEAEAGGGVGWARETDIEDADNGSKDAKDCIRGAGREAAGAGTGAGAGGGAGAGTTEACVVVVLLDDSPVLLALARTGIGGGDSLLLLLICIGGAGAFLRPSLIRSESISSDWSIDTLCDRSLRCRSFPFTRTGTSFCVPLDRILSSYTVQPPPP